MTTITQQALESYLWGAATLLRGLIDVSDHKQSIFESGQETRFFKQEQCVSSSKCLKTSIHLGTTRQKPGFSMSIQAGEA
jgi:hypothetical protein